MPRFDNIVKKTPTPLQIDALTFYMQQDRWMNLSDPGCQKTGSVCLYIHYLWFHKKCKTLWAMPKSLLHKNKVELLEFTDFKPEEIVIVDGTPTKREKLMADPKAKVFLMSFTRYALSWESLLGYHPEINATMVDEIHLGFKTHDSKRSISLFRSMQKIKYFGAMSGTIIDGRLDSCYPSIHVIEPRYYASHYSFLMQHGEFDEYGTICQWTNHSKIGQIFLQHGFRKTFKEVHGDVKYVTEIDWCEMHPKQAEAFKEFEKESILELESYLDNIENDILEGMSPGVKTIRCRQIMSDPHMFKILKEKELTGKDERLLIHIEDHINTGEPLLIFSAFPAEQRRIAKLIEAKGLTVGVINGGVSTKVRERLDLDFREGRLDVLIGSPETCAIGYNWGHVNHIIFVSIDYKNTNFTQGVRRAIRGLRDIPLRVTVLAYDTQVERSNFYIVNAKSRHLNKVDDSYEILTLGV